MPRKSLTGSFLQITLAPGYYAYARMLADGCTYGLYDLLAPHPIQDMTQLVQAPVCLLVGLVEPPAWMKVGRAPLEPTWPTIWRFWTAEALPITMKDIKNQIMKPETEYFLIEEWIDVLTKVAHSRKTPATPESLRGLVRWSLYTPEFVEEKLREHFGLTLTGARVPPLPLQHQLPW